MKSILSSLFRPALLALGVVLMSVILPAADTKAPVLPLQATFEKATPGERGGPYCVKLTNTSAKAVKVAAEVQFSVGAHPMAKGKSVPAAEIAAGKSLTIADLAVEDRITVSAEGYAPLVLKVPPAKK